MRRDAFREMVSRAVSAIALAVLACCALGALSPAARADGDPGSDVLVYQNLFVAADSNVSIAQQLGLGDLLSSASRDGFTIRVAIVATPADLGAITQLWRKPASYASFLGIELSLAYSQRLLVVMPDGFGFSWQGHSAGAAYQVLGKIRVEPGGTGLATSAEAAVRALAAASGVRLAAPAAGQAAGTTGGGGTGTGTIGSANGAAGGDAAGQPSPSGGQQAAAPVSGLSGWLIAVIATAALAAIAVGGWLARRAGLRLPAAPGLTRASRAPRRWLTRWSKRSGRPNRLAIPGTWLAGGIRRDRSRPDRRARGAPPSAGAAPSGSASADAAPGRQPEPRPGDAPVHRRARLHADRPVRPAGVARLLPRQGRDPRVQRLRVHHRSAR